MGTKAKSYYRNWYQYWKEEEQAKLERSLAEVNTYQYEVEPSQYKANHEFNRKSTTYTSARRKKTSPYQQTMKNSSQMADISLSNKNYFSDMFRAVLVVVPLIAVVLTLLYVTGVIPQETINQLFGSHSVSPVTAYIEEYDNLMTLHNEINQDLAAHISANNLTPLYLEELQSQYEEISELTKTLVANEDTSFSDMGRLLNYKLLSLNQLISQVESDQAVTDSVTQTYNQFVSDQNEIGDQIVVALTDLLDTNNISYTSLGNGSIEIK